MTTTLPVAYVFSGKNILSENLIKTLSDKGCKVVWVTPSSFSEKFREVPQYLFLIQGFSYKDSFFSKIQVKKILEISQNFAPRTLVVLPYVVNDLVRRDVEWVASESKRINNRGLWITYMGQIYGIGMELGGNYFGDIFASIWRREPIRVSIYDFDFYTLSIEKALKHLIKGIFSYGFEKQEIVITNKIKCFDFLKEIQKIIPATIFATDRSISAVSTISNFDFLDVEHDTKTLKETIEWLLASNVKKVEKTIKPPKEKRVRKLKFKKVNKKFLWIVLVVFWILALPFVSLFISIWTLDKGFKNLESFNFDRANFYFTISKNLSSFTKPVFFFFSEGAKTFSLVDSFSIVGEDSISSMKLIRIIAGEVQGTNDYDLNGQANQLYLDLDNLYKEVGFLRADIDGSSLKGFLPSDINLSALSLYSQNGRDIATNLPTLLGANQKTNYLILLQDSKELKPTGGTIKSLVTYTFDKGKLVDKVATDIAAADKQLLGIVTPPAQLTKYSGAYNWYLKDSNWDPSFATSASKAEWFLSNEMNQNVDGVFAIDSDLFNRLTNFSGNFFDGGNKIVTNFNLKNILAYFNDNKIESIVGNLKWDGGVTINSIGLAEANLGENQVNPNITRNANLTIDMSGAITRNVFQIDYTNFSTTLPYRTFIRLLAPLDANFGRVILSINGKVQYINPDVEVVDNRTEGGVLIQVPAGQKASIIFTWTLNNMNDFTKVGTTTLVLRKQPGVTAMPTFVTFVLPKSLTTGSSTRYNTDLSAGDFETQIKW